jgi:hypothetical protein
VTAGRELEQGQMLPLNDTSRWALALGRC